MAETKYATYKRYNGTDWDTIYFATSAGQVGETSSRFFIKPSQNTVNGKQFSQTGGITLYGSDITFNGVNQNYVTANSTFNSALVALDTKLKAVSDIADTLSGVYSDGTILTTTNYATTLGSVYQAKNNNLTLISSLTGAGFACRESDTSWKIYKASEMLTQMTSIGLVPNSRTVNGKKLTGNITLTGSDIAVSSSDSTKISDKLTSAIEIAQGKTATYVIDASKVGNTSFYIEKTKTTSSVTVANTGSLTTTDGSSVALTSLKVGDIILTTGAGIKDWYFGGMDSATNTNMVFYQIDSDTPDLTGYALKSYVTSSISALGLGDASKKGVATSITGSTNLPTDAAVKSFVEGKGYITSYVNTTYVFDTGAENGTFKWTAYSGASTPSGGGNVSIKGLAAAAYRGITDDIETNMVVSNLTSEKAVSDWVSKRATKIFYADTVPTTGMIAGDICIEY